MVLFSVVSYVSLYLLLAFCALCIATGLYYLSEIAEEYTVFTKKSISYAIKGICGIYGLLWLFGDLPFTYAAFGAISHAVYGTLLHGFPFFQVRQIKFIASVAVFVLSQWVWWRYFTSPYVEDYSSIQVLAFCFAMVWSTPFAFFISLSLYDFGMPIDGFGPKGGAANIDKNGPLMTGKKRTSLMSIAKNKISSVVDSVKSLRP
eukprot:ANDGO_05962.mRNA.1 Protein TEX261 homolog